MAIDFFFIANLFFVLKNMHIGDVFGRLGPDTKYFSTFFWLPLWGDPFWTSFWAYFGPILDLFWTYFGPKFGSKILLFGHVE